MSSALEALRILNGRWQPFAEENREAARMIRELALVICEQMTGDSALDQIAKMHRAPEFEEFRKLMLAHKEALGIEEGSDQDLAIWVRTICYCATMHAEKASV